MLEQRIDDVAFVNLIRKWLKAGILDTDGKVINPETGTPQGGIVSPVLANIYLHFVLDLWFEKRVKVHCKGEAFILRYADDFICALNRKLQGHYNYYNVPGNLHALWRFYKWAVECAFKCLNRRGGKRKSFTWRVFTKAIDRRKHRVFAQ